MPCEDVVRVLVPGQVAVSTRSPVAGRAKVMVTGPGRLMCVVWFVLAGSAPGT
jgi:hypothetical protein